MKIENALAIVSVCVEYAIKHYFEPDFEKIKDIKNPESKEKLTAYYENRIKESKKALELIIQTILTKS